jgi:PII-like signaling protein
MKIKGSGKQIKIFIGASDQWHQVPLYSAIVKRAREEGLAGATVMQGAEGFGAHSRIHTTRILRLSEDLPVVIEIVDKPERIEKFLPVLDEMVTEGLVTVQDVDIAVYRHRFDSEDGK